MNQTPAQAPPDYGPSLPEIVRPWLRARPRWQRVALGAALVALVALVAALVVRSEAEVKTYRQTQADARERGLDPIDFRFDRSSKLAVSKPEGA